MRTFLLASCLALIGAAPPAASPPSPTPPPAKSGAAAAAETERADAGIGTFRPEAVTTDGSVTIGGARIDYRAIAGTIVVHPKDWDDVPQRPQTPAEAKTPEQTAQRGENNPTAEASMFYVAYLQRDARPENRPITFLFNGGPGSASVWLHMGAFGPRRVVTADDTHTPAAPYHVVENGQSLLDASDLVFVDAPGTGFSRIAGHDKEKAFWGIDPDAHAFADFIESFLSRYGRWNSPKFVFGESYGTTRAAVLANMLAQDRAIDLNGVILLSQVLNFDLSIDQPSQNPGVDLGYVLALPSYAASAAYHHRLPGGDRPLDQLLPEVEAYATGPYLQALLQGATLPAAQRDAVARQLHSYTGLPEAYLRRARLRVEGGMFERMLLDDQEDTTGRLDARFSGPSLDPLSKEADYDPQSSAISSAYVAAFNDYVRGSLHFGQDRTYKPFIDVGRAWSFKHRQPGQQGEGESFTSPNVMPDLADAMIVNPGLRVMLNAGYYDLATPFFQGMYELRHLPMPERLQSNITMKFYASGHMVYANDAARTQLHDNVAAFLRGR